MIKAILFDMDGVIIDSEPIHSTIEQEHFKNLGIVMDKKYHDSFVGTTSYFMWNTLKEKHNLSDTIEHLAESDRNTFFQFVQNSIDLKPIPYAAELIKDLSENNLKLAVASSSPIRTINLIVEKFELSKYFLKLVTGDSVKASKPSPDIFLLAAKLLDTAPHECVVIEDSTNGIKAAKAAGMKCIGYKGTTSSNQDLSLADMTIESFSEVTAKQLLEYFNNIV